jgi:beta-lactamase regulating signal transducer with metallopeptidase domain/predicted esterase
MNLITQTFAGPFPLIQLTLKVTLLLLLFLSLWMMFRRKSASFRHSILVVALLSLPCLCLAQFLVPSQRLPWLQKNVVASFEDAFDYSSENDPRSSRLILDGQSETQVVPRTSTVPHPETLDGPVSTLSSPPSSVFYWSARSVLLAIWLGVAAVLLLRFAAAWFIVRRMVLRSPKLDLQTLDLPIRGLVEELESNACEFRVNHDSGQMPLCFGLFRNIVLLPREFSEWELEDQKSVVLHESAHAYRRDCLVNVLAHLESAVLWFHPLSWTLLHFLKAESEMACDDWAIARGMDSVNYASALFDVTMSTKRKPMVSVVSVSMADCSPLEKRMQSILSPAVPRRPISLLGHLVVAVVSVALILFLSAFHLGPSSVAQDSGADALMKTEHRILLNDGNIIRGQLTGSIKLETTYGNATLDLEKLRSVKRVEGGKHEILTDDDSVLTGIIRQDKLKMQNDATNGSVRVSDLKRITTIGNANLIPEKITSGFLKDGISYHIRAPKGYLPGELYPSIVFLHDANSNSKDMINKFAKGSPKVADRFLLIGINGENKSKKVKDCFNYTYINFAGRSKYKGFPGTDRESPALVMESIVDLKDRIPISKTILLGEGDGAFLAFSIAMNYPEMISGAITTNGGLLVQTAPDAYDDEELIAKQKKVWMSVLHFNPDKDHKKSHAWNAEKAFRKAGFRHRFYNILDERAIPQILQREIRRNMKFEKPKT